MISGFQQKMPRTRDPLWPIPTEKVAAKHVEAVRTIRVEKY